MPSWKKTDDNRLLEMVQIVQIVQEEEIQWYVFVNFNAVGCLLAQLVTVPLVLWARWETIWAVVRTSLVIDKIRE